MTIIKNCLLIKLKIYDSYLNFTILSTNKYQNKYKQKPLYENLIKLFRGKCCKTKPKKY